MSLSLSKEIQKHWNEEKKRRATAKTGTCYAIAVRMMMLKYYSLYL